MMRVVTPATSEQLDDVRSLMRAFNAWHRARHPMDLELIDSYFDAAAFDHELTTLPGNYAPPQGALLLALIDEVPVGCVALKKIDDDACEMKRMFVYPQYHGHGVGKALCEAIIAAGREAGYRVMRLDTSIRQSEAQGLYSRLGFRMIAPYYELSGALRDWLVFMELEL